MTDNKYEIIDVTQGAMSVQDLGQQIQLIQHHMKQNMQQGQHYGLIPGCGDKPTLLKPGAEKLCFIFRLSPEVDISVTELGNNHREYTCTCTLKHIPTGALVAQGVGSCSTMEKKYRYRSTNTGKPVPQDYWKHREQELLGSPTARTRKVDGQWVIFEQMENEDPADVYNTVLKMAKKRAQVDATLSATAASDIFTQDIEDMDIETKPAAKVAKPAKAKKTAKKNGAGDYILKTDSSAHYGEKLKDIPMDWIDMVSTDNEKASKLAEGDLDAILAYKAEVRAS